LDQLLAFIVRNPVPVFTLITGLLVAFLGLTGVLAGAYFKAEYDKKLEREKAEIARRDGLRRELQSLVSELAAHFYTAIHAMHWVTWFVKERPSTLTEDRLNEYNKEMRAVLPQITGTHFAIATMDEQIGNAATVLVDALYKLDVKIASLGLRLPTEKAEVEQGLIESWGNVRALEERFQTELGDMVIRKGLAVAGPLPTNAYQPATKARPRLGWG
jgi:hypothetical protein